MAVRAHHRMVDLLRAAGRVRTAAVEEAFRAVPRHHFLPDRPVAEAYADEAVAVQTVDGVTTSSASQPSMMAIMLEQLALRPGDRVLEIGAGTGYNAALMARIVGPAGSVTAVDIDAELIDSAAAHLAAAGVTGVELRCADGALGHPEGAPYDRIVLTVGSSDVRPEWVAQLAPGGRLLLPLALRGSQLSVALDLGADGLLRSDSVRSCFFIRLRGVAAEPDGAVAMGESVRLHVPADAATPPDPLAVAAALAIPGAVRPTPVQLGSHDVWDGFGLWLALTEPDVVRLTCDDPEEDDGDTLGMFAIGSGLATVALTGTGSGLALVGPNEDGDRWTGSVREFGSGGGVPAERMLTALVAWDGAGRPQASDLRLLVAPVGPAVTPAGAALVTLTHAVVTAWFTAGSV